MPTNILGDQKIFWVQQNLGPKQSYQIDRRMHLSTIIFSAREDYHIERIITFTKIDKFKSSDH